MVPAAEHALSVGRLALAAWVLGELKNSLVSAWVLPAVVLACVTDFLDGRIARSRGPVGAIGRWIDDLCDVGFLAACFLAFARAGAFAARTGPTGGMPDLDMLPLFALFLSSVPTRSAPRLVRCSAGISRHLDSGIGPASPTTASR